MVEETIKFPTEIIDLPSKGYFYPEGHPLHGVSELEVRHMTTAEEDILTSRVLLKKGVGIDKFLSKLIVPDRKHRQFYSFSISALKV